MNRNGKWYRDLCDLIKRRDADCAETYAECIPGGVPWGDVHVHHIKHRGGCADRDVEENLISLDPYVHAMLHAGNEMEYRNYIYTYMESEEVQAWREEHAEEIAEILSSKEDSLLRKRQRAHKLKKGIPVSHLRV